MASGTVHFYKFDVFYKYRHGIIRNNKKFIDPGCFHYNILLFSGTACIHTATEHNIIPRG